jgi:Fe-S-cluster containining protein
VSNRGRGKDPEALAKALAQVYEQVPSTNCQGLCADSCCSFAMTTAEQTNIRVQAGVQLPLAHAGSYCPALTMFRQCGVYEVRPLICRIWGAVASMRCNYGCVPEGGFLTDHDAMRLLAQVNELAGDDRAAAEYRAVLAADPDVVGRFMRSRQKERDLAFLEKSSRSGAVFVAGPGRLAKKPPR